MKGLSFRMGIAAVIVFLAAAAILSLCAGQGGASVVCKAVMEHDPASLAIFWEIRFPRVLMAAGIGAALAVSGAIFQTILHNQLAEPYILGVSGGASLGFVTAYAIWGWGAMTGMAAFSGGLLTLAAVFCVGGNRGEYGLLLSGVMINAFCGSILLLAMALLHGNDLGRIMFWFLGDIGYVNCRQALQWLVFFCLTGFLLVGASHKLDLLLLGEDAALCLGAGSRNFILVMLLLVTVLVSGSVAAAGPIGFVGLVVPQVIRMLAGSRHIILLPASLACGAAFLMLCDAIARMLPLQGELPIGVVTSFIGAPVFICLLCRKKHC